MNTPLLDNRYPRGTTIPTNVRLRPGRSRREHCIHDRCDDEGDDDNHDDGPESSRYDNCRRNQTTSDRNRLRPANTLLGLQLLERRGPGAIDSGTNKIKIKIKIKMKMKINSVRLSAEVQTTSTPIAILSATVPTSPAIKSSPRVRPPFVRGNGRSGEALADRLTLVTPFACIRAGLSEH